MARGIGNESGSNKRMMALSGTDQTLTRPLFGPDLFSVGNATDASLWGLIQTK